MAPPSLAAIVLGLSTPACLLGVEPGRLGDDAGAPHAGDADPEAGTRDPDLDPDPDDEDDAGAVARDAGRTDGGPGASPSDAGAADAGRPALDEDAGGDGPPPDAKRDAGSDAGSKPDPSPDAGTRDASVPAGPAALPEGVRCSQWHFVSYGEGDDDHEQVRVEPDGTLLTDGWPAVDPVQQQLRFCRDDRWPAYEYAIRTNLPNGAFWTTRGGKGSVAATAREIGGSDERFRIESSPGGWQCFRSVGKNLYVSGLDRPRVNLGRDIQQGYELFRIMPLDIAIAP